MNKLKVPVALNATIYNNLVKVFNDASNGIIDGFKYNISPDLRNKIIELRKQFPTYQELKDSGITFVDAPIYLDVDQNGNKSEVAVRSWIGSFDLENQTSENANILDASVVYTIAFSRFVNTALEPDIALKVRGIPKNLEEAEELK